MALQVSYRGLIEDLLRFVTQPEFQRELLAGRTEYVQQTGEAFDEDRSFDARMQGFLDWFLFDRPLAPFHEPPVRAYPIAAKLDAARAQQFQILSRTVHGLFEVRASRTDAVELLNLLTGAHYKVELAQPYAGLDKGELFEGRLVPYAGRRHLSHAFIFHPREIRGALMKEVKRLHREQASVSVQELIFTLARMANRAEHYRYVKTEDIYDFSRPPPKVDAPPLRFDRESIEKRLGRTIPDAASAESVQ